MKDKYGICPKCFQVRKLTRHHALPKRYFGDTNHKLWICRDCHDEIEKILPLNIKYEHEQYIEIHKQWLMHKPVLAI